MLLSFIVIFAVLIFTRRNMNPSALVCLPVVMIVEYVLALGFTMIMSAVTVYIRDAEYIIGIVTMAWQFLTPVMYSMDQVPEDIRWVFILNPMTYIITAYRDILYLAQIPKLETLVSAVIIGITLLIVGWGIFCKLQKHFVEEL